MGIIRCAFNKPWSPIGILSYAQVNNGWRSGSSSVYDSLEVKRQKSESISVSKVKQQHSTPQVKKIHSSGHLCQIITAETREATGCRVSTDRITIWIMGFSFFGFWQGLSIRHACKCSPTDAPSVTNTELLSASSSSPFQANKFIHPILWLLGSALLGCLKKRLGLLTSGLSGWLTVGDRKRKQGQ